MKTNFLLLAMFFCCGAVSFAQNVNIPDAIFKAVLVGNAAINTNGDSEIQVSEASAYVSTINVSGLGISDLTGIEAFIGITRLSCYYNQLTSLNISNNIYLKELYCYDNQLSFLNLSNSTNLEKLDCNRNQLTYLNIFNNINLIELQCSENKLTSLDISNNTNLYTLFCYKNELNALNISNNTNLYYFYCTSNPNLTCIQVWDTIYANSQWSVGNGEIDPQMYFSLDCSNVSTAENLSSYFTFSPNPASDYLYIDSKGEKNVSYTISDIWGRSIEAWQNKTEVPISHLPVGIYFLTAQVGDKIAVKKFIKE